MKFGVVTHNTEYGIMPDFCARAAEERGFESIWFPEHTHIPASRQSPYPLGGELPRQYLPPETHADAMKVMDHCARFIAPYA